MPSFIEMPKLSDTMTEGTLAKWLIKEGDTIKNGQELADVETDKATMAMTSFKEGTVGKLLVTPGQKAPLGAPLAVVLEDGEAMPANLDELVAAAVTKATAPAAVKADSGSSKSTSRSESAPGSRRLPSAPQHQRRSGYAADQARVKASPLARKIAAERGVDLTRLIGTGPSGRIVRFDVETAPTGGASAVRVAAVPTIRPVVGPEDERVPVSSMRNIIAERLLASKTQIPHFYLQIELDTAPLMKLRAHLNLDAEKTGGNKYTVNDLVLKAVISAAKAAPAVNAAWDGDAIVKFKSIGLSIAIAVDDGLVTPVIKNAESKTMLQISQEVKDLAGKSKNKKLSPDDFAGGTITVSNLGSYGIDSFSAIINPPQAAILSVGSIRKVPVVDEKGAVVAGQRMWIGLSGDHRVVDGAVAAQFLGELKKYVESPTLMLV